MTHGAGLLIVRQLWDQLHVGAQIDQRTAAVDRRYRSALFIEVWVALLLYGGGVMDDLARFSARGVRRLFGWRAAPDATTFGRWLRRGGATLVPVLDELCWYLVRARWIALGRPASLMLILDSTVVQRNGLRQAGIRDLTVRVDKGFLSRDLVELLMALEVRFVLKVPDDAWVRRHLGAWRSSEKDETRRSRRLAARVRHDRPPPRHAFTPIARIDPVAAPRQTALPYIPTRLQDPG